MKKKLICVSCPIGCELEVKIEKGEFVSLEGNLCPRGESYARQECLNPSRMVTSSIIIPGNELPLSVRTDKVIPKKLIFECLKLIENIQPQLPVKAGDILQKNILNTEVNIIATRNDC